MHPSLTDEDLALLRSLPIFVAVAAASADHDDGRGSTAEVLAGLRAIVAGAEAAHDNGLVTRSFEAYKADGAGEAELLTLSQDPPAGVHETMLGRCRQAASRFGDQSPDWAELTRWLRDIAAAVTAASAAGGVPGLSSLLGIGGEHVTQGESELLADLALALGVVGE